ncbi:unnamed protein product [Cuscuta europaea]|uniref:Transposase (putative) gypsy type domain-containing protein n=1 Tax=Cuscuta europaea TaxID=41803 RepID=A0A9P1E0Y8_CUSEU|nr:unnamed protein product [Cuscuta europaea]
MQGGRCSPHENNDHTDSGLSAIIEAERGAAARPMWVSHGPRPRMHAGVTTGRQADVLPELAPARRVATSEGRPLDVPDRACIQPVNVPDSDDDSDTRVDLDSWWDLDSNGIPDLPSRVTEGDLVIAYSLIGDNCLLEPPVATDVLSDPPASYFGVHIRSLELGMAVPLHPFLVRFLHFLGVAPGQLAPAAHMFVAAFVARCEDVGLIPMIDLIFSCFHWRASSFFALLSQRPVSKLFRSGYPRSGKGWKKRWIWVSDPNLLSPLPQWGERVWKCDRVALSPGLKSSIEVLSAGGPHSISSYLAVPEKLVVEAESDEEEEPQQVIVHAAATAAKGKGHGAPPPRRVRVTFGPRPTTPVQEKHKGGLVDLLVKLDGSDEEEEPCPAVADVAPKTVAGKECGASSPGRGERVSKKSKVTPKFHSAEQVHEGADERMAERSSHDTQHTVTYAFPSSSASIMHEGFPVVDYASSILPPGDLTCTTSQEFHPPLEGSIRSHIEGLAKTIRSLHAANHSQARLQREADEARAVLWASQKAFSELRSSHAQECEEAAKQGAKKALSEFQASEQFQKLISARVQAEHSELVQRWLTTPDGEYWRAREVLYAFQSGKYLVQQKVYGRLKDLDPDFHPSTLGLSGP